MTLRCTGTSSIAVCRLSRPNCKVIMTLVGLRLQEISYFSFQHYWVSPGNKYTRAASARGQLQIPEPQETGT